MENGNQHDERSPDLVERPRILEAGLARQDSDASNYESNNDIPESEAGYRNRITVNEPKRPLLPDRNTWRAQSSKSVSEALRAARAREEQETLLGEHEQADDDGCYPPRLNDEPRAPNPHKNLPVYTTIHKIRRLVIACIGANRMCPCV